MPLASHRFDLLVLPTLLEQAVDMSAVEGLFERWAVDKRGRSPHAVGLISGGCKRIWIDQPGRLWLYANQMGGFRVSCPATEALISTDFGRAHRAWKQSGPRTLSCSSCGQIHPLEDCLFRPPAAFARWALVFSDAADVALTPKAVEDIATALGPTQVLIRRP